MTTRARAPEIADADVAPRDHVELLVIESNGTSSRVLCLPLDSEVHPEAPSLAPRRQELSLQDR